MYRTIRDFLDDGSTESAATTRVYEQLKDEALGERVAGSRSLGRLAWHIAATLQEMLERTGLDIDSALQDHHTPSGAAEIVEAYRRGAARVSEEVGRRWRDEDLRDEVEMYGERWAKGKVLMVLILHQAHHRGQMTVLMRQAGLPVPGVAGPSREEWTAMGMQPMD